MNKQRLYKQLDSSMKSRIEHGLEMKSSVRDLKQQVKKELQKQAASIRVIKRLAEERDHLWSRLSTMSAVVSEDVAKDGRSLVAVETVTNVETQIKNEIESNAIRLNVVRKELNQSTVLESTTRADLFSHANTSKQVKSTRGKQAAHRKDESHIRRLAGFNPANIDVLLEYEEGSSTARLVDFESDSSADVHLQHPVHRRQGGLLTLASLCTDEFVGMCYAFDQSVYVTAVQLDDCKRQTNNSNVLLAWKPEHLATHPLDQFLLASGDGIVLIDLRSMRVGLDLSDRVVQEGWDESFKFTSIHPDGKLLSLARQSV